MVPYSKLVAVLTELALTVPLRVALVAVTPPAEPVVTVGAATAVPLWVALLLAGFISPKVVSPLVTAAL